MQQVMGPMPADSRKVPLDAKVVSEEKLDGYVRKKITFAAEKGDRVPAWLLLPHPLNPNSSFTQERGESKKLPAMLCLHQTITIGKDEPVGLGKQESKQQALHLVKRGYICLAPDYPSFGEYKYDFAAAFQSGDYASGTMKAIWNNMRAIDLLESLPEVDKTRIGAIGHSLGGHNTLFTAAFDERIQVAVTSCGFCSFSKYYGGNLKGWTSDRYMPRIASEYGNDPKKMPFDFTDVLSAIAPRAVFVMAPTRDSNFDVEGVKDVMKVVTPVYEKLKAADQLKVIHPDAGHEWPEDARKDAYQFVDQVLKK
jgi:dienelactone hydrolase